MTFANSDGSITRRQDKELQAANNSAGQVEEKIAVQQGRTMRGGRRWEKFYYRLLGIFMKSSGIHL
jgi:hypothetical protein